MTLPSSDPIAGVCPFDSTAITVGQLHNRVLKSLMNNGISYSLPDSKINIAGMYDDALLILESLGINDTLSSNPTYRQEMIEYCQAVEDAAQIKDRLNETG